MLSKREIEMEASSHAAPVRRYSRREAAAYLTALGYPIAEQTLNRLAWEGEGPPYFLFGRRVFYVDSDLIAWARSREKRRGPVPADSDAEKGKLAQP